MKTKFIALLTVIRNLAASIRIGRVAGKSGRGPSKRSDEAVDAEDSAFGRKTIYYESFSRDILDEGDVVDVGDETVEVGELIDCGRSCDRRYWWFHPAEKLGAPEKLSAQRTR